MIGSINIAMRVQTKQLKAGLSQSAAMLQSFEARVTQTGGALKALFAGAAVYGAIGGLKKIVTAASDVTEATNLMDTVFGKSAGTIIADADKMAAAFGTSKKEYLDAAGELGGIFKGVGYGADEAAKLSIAMIRLADDMSSQKNLTFAESLQKISSGLSGESEPLKRVGVLMDEDTVKAQAYASGIAKMGAELTQAQKVQARMQVITKSLANTQGDHARTADEVAGATRGLEGRIANLAATLGQVLEPIAKSVFGELNTGLMAIQIAWQQSGRTALDASGQQVEGAAQASHSIGFLQQAVGSIADAWQNVRLMFLFVQEKIAEGLIFMVKNFGGFAEGINNIVGYFTGITVATGDFTKTWLEDLERIKKAQQETFDREAVKPLASQAVNEVFAQARAKIQQARQDFLKQPDISGIKPGESTGLAKKAATPKEVKFAQAMLAGSSEAASTILRSRFGAGKSGDEAKTQTKLQTRIAEGVSKMATALTAGEAIALMPTL
jgi:hypothetical protein